MSYPKIGLDIDDCLAGWCGHFFDYLGMPNHPAETWHDPRIDDNFYKIKDDLEFWQGIPRMVHPSEITLPIHCYCTARPIDSSETTAWLLKNGFPNAEVRTVGYGGSKVEELRDVDFFLDDAIHNFKALNGAGINCYLLTRSHNKNYVTDKRCDSLEDFFRICQNKEVSL